MIPSLVIIKLILHFWTLKLNQMSKFETDPEYDSMYDTLKGTKSLEVKVSLFYCVPLRVFAVLYPKCVLLYQAQAPGPVPLVQNKSENKKVSIPSKTLILYFI